MTYTNKYGNNNLIDNIIVNTGRKWSSMKRELKLWNCDKHIRYMMPMSDIDDNGLMRDEYRFQITENRCYYPYDKCLQDVYKTLGYFLPNEIIEKILSFETFCSPMMRVYKEMIFFDIMRRNMFSAVSRETINLEANMGEKRYIEDWSIEEGRLFSLVAKMLQAIDYGDKIINAKMKNVDKWDFINRIQHRRKMVNENYIFKQIGKKKDMELFLRIVLEDKLGFDFDNSQVFNSQEEEEKVYEEYKKSNKECKELMSVIVIQHLKYQQDFIYEALWRDCYNYMRKKSSRQRFCLHDYEYGYSLDGSNVPMLWEEKDEIVSHWKENMYELHGRVFTSRYGIHNALLDNWTNRMLCNWVESDTIMTDGSHRSFKRDKHLSRCNGWIRFENDKESLMEYLQNDFDRNKIPIKFAKSWNRDKMIRVWYQEGRELFESKHRKSFKKVFKQLLKKTKVIEANVYCKDCGSKKVYKYELCKECMIIRLSL